MKLNRSLDLQQNVTIATFIAEFDNLFILYTLYIRYYIFFNNFLNDDFFNFYFIQCRHDFVIQCLKCSHMAVNLSDYDVR